MSSNIEVKRICKFCSKEFIARTTVTMYCSRICNKRDYTKKQRTSKIKKGENDFRIIENKNIDKIKAKDFLSVKDASILLDTSKRTIYRMITTGIINSVNLAERKTIIRRTDIENLFTIKKPQSSGNNDNLTIEENLHKTYDLDEWIKSGGKNVNECYNLTEIQQKYGISENALHVLIERNGIPKLKIGWYAYVPKEAIDRIFNKT